MKTILQVYLSQCHARSLPTIIRPPHTLFTSKNFSTLILQINHYAYGHVASIDRPHLHDELQVERVYETMTVATGEADLQTTEVCIHSILKFSRRILYIGFQVHLIICLSYVLTHVRNNVTFELCRYLFQSAAVPRRNWIWQRQSSIPKRWMKTKGLQSLM